MPSDDIIPERENTDPLPSVSVEKNTASEIPLQNELFSPHQPARMEVQKHPHHVMHKKKWNEYLLEFFMLFLAVFLGFIAENIREKNVEHHREKEYMQSLVKDIQRDTAMLALTLTKVEKNLSYSDSLLHIIYNELYDPVSINKMYSLYSKVFRIPYLQYVDRTSSQLRNAGGMRLIRNQQVVDSITYYWRLAEAAKLIGDKMFAAEDKASDVGFKIFLYKYYEPSNEPFKNTIKDGTTLSPIAGQYLPEFANRLASIREIMKNYKFFIEKDKAFGATVIDLITEKYNLKEE